MYLNIIIIAKANGSGIKMAVTATDLGKELFVVPAIEEQRNFENFVYQVDKSKFMRRQYNYIFKRSE